MAREEDKESDRQLNTENLGQLNNTTDDESVAQQKLSSTTKSQPSTCDQDEEVKTDRQLTDTDDEADWEEEHDEEDFNDEDHDGEEFDDEEDSDENSFGARLTRYLNGYDDEEDSDEDKANERLARYLIGRDDEEDSRDGEMWERIGRYLHGNDEEGDSEEQAFWERLAHYIDGHDVGFDDSFDDGYIEDSITGSAALDQFMYEQGMKPWDSDDADMARDFLANEDYY